MLTNSEQPGVRWKATYHVIELLCGNYLTKSTKTLRVNWATAPMSRTPHACSHWQNQPRETVRLCSKVMHITASCCIFWTLCDVRCFFNKNQVILNVYKTRLIFF